MDNVELLYRELLLHYATMTKYTRHIDNVNISYSGKNLACGDVVNLEGYVDRDGIFRHIKVEINGCFVSKASTNLMAGIIEGKTLSKIYELVEDYIRYITGKKEKLEMSENKELEILEGVRKFPTRIKCALIGWESLLEALKLYEKKQDNISR
ncbi:MAG: Fe-S cluster assembly sulfur transfer protein SufU [Planctomycetota bacterium]